MIIILSMVYISLEEGLEILTKRFGEKGRTGEVLLPDALGKIAGEDIVSAEDVPPFPRSPYDGYAFRSKDSEGASADNPKVLNIIEEVPAGSYPLRSVGENEAVKILTGAPIPYGADVVEKYEFDRELRLVLFYAIEIIEIALRTKMIYHLSLKESRYVVKLD